MGTFARDAANETVAADAALDAWMAARDLGRESTRAELEELVRELATRPDLWGHLIRHSPVERIYVRLHLDEHLELWVICWSQRQDTGFHDHDGSRGAVAVVGGALAERRLAVGGPPPPTAIHPAGAAFRSARRTSTTSPRPARSSPPRCTSTRPRWARWASTRWGPTAPSAAEPATTARSSASRIGVRPRTAAVRVS
jgi:hypothetical protein